MKIYQYNKKNADNFDVIEYKGYQIVFEQEFNIYDSDFNLIKSGLSTEEDAYEYIDNVLSKNTTIASDKEVDSLDTKEYVVYKFWKSFDGNYVYSFFSGNMNAGPWVNVRYSQDSIRKGSQKDVSSFSKTIAEMITAKFNHMSMQRGFKPNWEYSEKWW